MWFELNLVKQNIITLEQLLAAVQSQRLSRPPLGRLAIEHDCMTMAQVFQVLEAQADSFKLFGLLAAEMGFLSRDDLARLIMIQGMREPNLGDILVEQGAISQKRLDSERHRFQREVTDLYGVFDLDAAIA